MTIAKRTSSARRKGRKKERSLTASPVPLGLAVSLPQRQWEAWDAPHGKWKLTIDEEIERLIEKPHRPRLRARHELDVIGIECPYYHARFWIYLACNRALHVKQLAATRPETRKALDNTAKRVDAIMRALHSFNREASALDFGRALWRGPFFDKPDYASGNDVRRRIEAALEDLKKSEQAARYLQTAVLSELAAVKQDARIGEKSIFAHCMGFCWLALTGDQPAATVGGAFLSFVLAASQDAPKVGGIELDSLSEDDSPADEKGWERAIRNAVQHENASSSDPFARYSKPTNVPLNLKSRVWRRSEGRPDKA